jgi:hypothetical protein
MTSASAHAGDLSCLKSSPPRKPQQKPTSQQFGLIANQATASETPIATLPFDLKGIGTNNTLYLGRTMVQNP